MEQKRAGRHQAAVARAWPLLALLLCGLRRTATGAFVHPGARRSEAEDAPGSVGFRRSSDLGISHCSLLGVLGGSDVHLHVWLRISLPSALRGVPCRDGNLSSEACARTALVRGVAFLQDCRRSVPLKSPMIQMVQSVHLAKFSGRMYLRSPVTRQQYMLRVNVPQAPEPAVRVFPNSGKMRATNHVMDVVGELQLHPDDVHAVDFELRVEGFRWYCNVLVEDRALGRAPGEQPVGGLEALRLHADANAPTLAETPAQDGETMQRQRLQQGPAAPRPGLLSRAARPAPVHVPRATLTAATEVWVLLAPFHGISVDEYARTLWYHVLWHVQLGVTRYLLYVFERLGALLAHPLIQALVRPGVLEVVSFLDLPKHEYKLLRPDLRDTYAMQVLQYNHALLALWGSDSLLLVVDLDEYLVTSTSPASALQVFKDCAAESGSPVAGVQLPRYDATCRQSAAPDVCDPGRPNREVWIHQAPDKVVDVAEGRRAHPLTGTTFRAETPRFQWDQKPLLDPGVAMNMHVHDISPAPGSVLCNASNSTVRLLHLLDFYALRVSAGGGQQGAEDARPAGEPDSLADVWMWPAQRLQDSARSAFQANHA